MMKLTKDSKQDLVRHAATSDKQRPLQLQIISKALMGRSQVQVGVVGQ